MLPLTPYAFKMKVVFILNCWSSSWRIVDFVLAVSLHVSISVAMFSLQRQTCLISCGRMVILIILDFFSSTYLSGMPRLWQSISECRIQARVSLARTRVETSLIARPAENSMKQKLWEGQALISISRWPICMQRRTYRHQQSQGIAPLSTHTCCAMIELISPQLHTCIFTHLRW